MATRDFGKWKMGEQDETNRVKIPPLPKYIALTDRADGKVWYLSHSLTVPYPDGLGLISLNDQQPFSIIDWVIYGPYDGPVIPSDGVQPSCRLLVRGGLLGYEPIADVVSSGPVFTRRGNAQETRLIYRPLSFITILTLAWTPEVVA